MSSGRRGVLATVALAVMAACAEPASDDADAATADPAALVGLSTSCEELSSVPGMSIERVDADEGRVKLRIGIMDPTGEARGDVLFLHGFSDRFDNHLPLFEGWRAAGLRVVAFDYPSHGETCGRGIDRFKIEGLAKLASFVEEHTRPASARPLVVAGWSTGGLVAVRTLQVPSLALGRKVDGAFLLAPGLDVKVLVGDKQRVTLETLTHDPAPPHRGEISPSSPLQTPLFSSDLLLHARHARKDAYPKDVPTVVVTGGEREDVYANTAGVRDWVETRRAEGAAVQGLACDGGRHELDNELPPIRDEVRESAARFARWVADGGRGRLPLASGQGCVRHGPSRGFD